MANPIQGNCNEALADLVILTREAAETANDLRLVSQGESSRIYAALDRLRDLRDQLDRVERRVIQSRVQIENLKR